jgi:hypothetical protein
MPWWRKKLGNAIRKERRHTLDQFHASSPEFVIIMAVGEPILPGWKLIRKKSVRPRDIRKNDRLFIDKTRLRDGKFGSNDLRRLRLDLKLLAHEGKANGQSCHVCF